MAGPWYVRSTDGDNGSDGLSWANAKATLAGAIAASSAGDTIYVSDAHAETQASALTLTFKGTQASPNVVLCVDDSAEPPTALATTATVSTTGGSAITVNGSFYAYGVSFYAGNSSSQANLSLSAVSLDDQHYEQCTLALSGTNSNSRVQTGNTNVRCSLSNAVLSFGSSAQGLNPQGTTVLRGVSLAGTQLTTALIRQFSNGANIRFIGCDLSALGAAAEIGSNSNTLYWLSLVNCKLPASWSTTLIDGTPASSARCEMINCDSTDTNYRLLITDATGSIRHDTSVYLDDGEYDGTTRVSYKFASTANCNFGLGRLYGPEFHVWNEDTGSSKTATVQICHDGASALTDGEIWLEVMYLGTSGYPLGSWISDAKAGYLASASAQASSSETWTGDSGTGPNGSSTWHQLKLEVTFTPQEKGTIVGRVVMGVASKTAYVDPNLIVT